MGASETKLLDLVKYQIGKFKKQSVFVFFERRKTNNKKNSSSCFHQITPAVKIHQQVTSSCNLFFSEG